MHCDLLLQCGLTHVEVLGIVDSVKNTDCYDDGYCDLVDDTFVVDED